MWSTSLIATLSLAAGLAVQVNAHAGVFPALAVNGKLSRDGVQQPNDGKPCGNVDVAKNLDSATPIAAGADGSFKLTGINFNGGGDGSLQFSAQVDATGAGKDFVAAEVTKNGDKAPSANESTVDLTAKLPAGTKCTGGKGGNTCLVAFKSTAGFGNCVAVTQGAGKRSNVGGARMARAARLTEPVRRAVDFGSCSTPSVDFGRFDGRKEDSFVPGGNDFSHGSALNVNVITGFICGQLNGQCKASQEAIDLCNSAKDAANGLKGQAAADAFNKAISA